MKSTPGLFPGQDATDQQNHDHGFVFFPALVLIRAAYWGWLAAKNKFKFSRLDNEEKAKLSKREFWKDFVINK